MKYKINFRTCASVLALQVAVAGVMSGEVSASNIFAALVAEKNNIPKAVAQKLVQTSGQDIEALKTYVSIAQEERRLTPDATSEHIIDRVMNPVPTTLLTTLGFDQADPNYNEWGAAGRLIRSYGLDQVDAADEASRKAVKRRLKAVRAFRGADYNAPDPTAIELWATRKLHRPEILDLARHKVPIKNETIDDAIDGINRFAIANINDFTADDFEQYLNADVDGKNKIIASFYLVRAGILEPTDDELRQLIDAAEDNEEATIMQIRHARQQAEELRLAEEEAARRIAEEAAARRIAEEAAARRIAEEEAAARRIAEEEAAARRIAEAAARRIAEEAAHRIAEEEAAARRIAEEAAHRIAEEEAAARRIAEEDNQEIIGDLFSGDEEDFMS